MKHFLTLMLCCFGLISTGAPLSLSDYSKLIIKGDSNIAQAADCSCHIFHDCRRNWDGAPDECGGPNWADYPKCISNVDYCQCRYYGTNDCSDPGSGTDPGGDTGGLTQVQLAAITAVAAALQNVQSYEGDAAGKLAALKNLYASLADLRSVLSDTLGHISGAVTTINHSLSKVTGYLKQGQALGPQALAMIKQQVVVAALQRGFANANNKNEQGCTIGDPVLVASGFETFKAEDFVYKAINEMIGVSRNFRSNQTDLNSSFGRSWFFNYDTKIVAGRKPLIQEREILTGELQQQAQEIANLATVALNEALNAVDIVVAKAVNARAKANEIEEIKNSINTLSSSIAGLSMSATSAANSASQNAAIAGTSGAQSDATLAQNKASNISGMASQASTTKASAKTIASTTSRDAFSAENAITQAQESVATIQGRNQAIQVVLAERITDSEVAAAEARLEEETYPLDPYPEDPTVYFGSGFIKYYTEKGTPILFEEDGEGHFKPVTDNGSYTDEVYTMEDDLRLTDKHGNAREFTHNQHGDYLLTRIVDANNNSTGFFRNTSNGNLNEIVDAVGRKTTFTYNQEGYINLITDPLGNEYSYSYDGDKLAVYTDPMGSESSYEYDAQARMLARTDPENNSFRYIYDSLNRVTSLIDKEGFVTHFSYDPENMTTIVTDPRGISTKYIYNKNNRLELTINPDGSNIGVAYDNRNNVAASRDENGNTSYFTYNDNNDIISVTNPLGEITTITYESNFNKVASVTNPLGRTRSFSYDNRGNLTNVNHPNGTSRLMAYSSAGLPISVTDENGNTTTLSYDKYNQLASITNADGTSKGITTDIIGRVIATTDENGFTNQIEYNSLNRIVRTIDPLGAETTAVYDALQRQIRKTDAKGNEYNYQYSKRSNITRIIDPLGNTETREYDESSNLKQKTYPNETGVTYSYDNRDRKLSQVTFPGNKETLYSYDLKGLRIAQQDANGNITSYFYDGADRLVTKVDAEGNNTSSVYDLAGNLTQISDANDNPISYSYDEMNQKIQETNALGNSTLFTFDGMGNLVQKHKPDGAVIQHYYDNRNRLIQSLYPDGSTKEYGYDNVGQMTSFANATTDETREYDPVGRLLVARDKYNGQIRYKYDILGNRTQVIDPDNGVMEYEYDAGNRVIAFIDPERNRTNYEYDSMGRIVGMTHPNYTSTTKVYDDDNRLSSMSTHSNRGNVLSSFSYTYDALGNKLTMTEESGLSTRYEYDKVYRLVAVNYPSRNEHWKTPGPTKNNGTNKGKGKKHGHHKHRCDETTNYLPSAERYVYDAVGNRLSLTDNWKTTEYQYNAANQMLQAGSTQFSYDENGNRIQKSESDNVTNYYYNDDDLMTQVDNPNGNSTGYGYDALNRRSYKVDQNSRSTDYLYDGIEVLQEISGKHRQKIATYYRANGRILSRQEYNGSRRYNHGHQHRPTGQQLYYSYDGLGSVASISNHGGKLKSRYHYDVYGKPITGDLSQNPYAFTGRRFDEETGMYKFHFRQYDPGTGVWTTPDPIGILGGINFYAYVGNNPTNLNDWLGLLTCGSGWNEALVPDNPGYPFSNCCYDHDEGYKNQLGFTNVNRAFEQCLQSVCDNLNLSDPVWSSFSSAEHDDEINHFQQTRIECNNLASLYSNAVTGKMGKEAYGAAASSRDIDSENAGTTDYGNDTDGWGE